MADVEKASTATTIRAVDEALTAPCFGFPSVDAYYADASADQRVKGIGVPLLIMNAADDPIAQYNVKEGVFDAETLAANPNLVVAVTETGGHLGLVRRRGPVRPAGLGAKRGFGFSGGGARDGVRLCRLCLYTGVL